VDSARSYNQRLTPDPLMKKKMTEIENYWKARRGTSWTPNRDIQSALKPWARVND